MKFNLGYKQKMVQFFAEDGIVHPATVVLAGPATVTQIKTSDTDGYDAVQVGFGDRNAKNINKPQLGHFGDKGTFAVVKEFRTEAGEIKAGDVIKADVFAEGDIVQVSGTSKGKGFQGVVKRHNFAGGPKSHGQKHSLRKPGSIGSTGPQRVLKGTRMAGRMGSNRITVKNLKVLHVDVDNNILIIKGALPGKPGSLVEIVAK
jgi:large subunit ribosomal protein L3